MYRRITNRLTLVVLMAASMSLYACGYSQLAAVKDIAEFRELEHASIALPQRTVWTDAGHCGDQPLRLAVHHSGRGDAERVIVLLHGIMSDSHMWRFVRPQIAAGCDLIAIDLPGCGESERPRVLRPEDRHYSPEVMARAVLTALRPHLTERPPATRVTLVGHSLGGMIALRMYADDAVRDEFADVLERIDGMVLVTPVDVVIEDIHPTFREIAETSDLTWMMADATGMLRDRIAHATRDGMADPGRAVREEADRLVEILRDPDRRHAAQQMIRQAVPWRLVDGRQRPDWPAIDGIAAGYRHVSPPCLILWGAEDATFPQSMGYKLAMQIPNARLVIVKQTMHSLPTEQPRLCSALVRGFITRDESTWLQQPQVSEITTPAETAPAQPSQTLIGGAMP